MVVISLNCIDVSLHCAIRRGAMSVSAATKKPNTTTKAAKNHSKNRKKENKSVTSKPLDGVKSNTIINTYTYLWRYSVNRSENRVNRKYREEEAKT